MQPGCARLLRFRGSGSAWPLALIAGTVPATCRVPVALEQLNLKVPPAVIAHWRAQAAAQSLSVRDWLISITAPTEAPAAGPAGGAALADRVAQLEAAAAELREAVTQLQAQGPPPRSPRPAPAAPPPVLIPADLPADGIETTALAQLLGLRRGTLNARIARLGGPAPGLVVDGWRCLGQRTPDRGGPPRALWVPAAT